MIHICKIYMMYIYDIYMIYMVYVYIWRRSFALIAQAGVQWCDLGSL